MYNFSHVISKSLLFLEEYFDEWVSVCVCLLVVAEN